MLLALPLLLPGLPVNQLPSGTGRRTDFEWAWEEDDAAAAAAAAPNWPDDEVRGGMALGDWNRALRFLEVEASEEEGTAIAEGSF